ncbi:hypothetical protein [Micromonospora carbonacea]|uniref:Uncharacterized protein n=1 Tax=Micromonospora carbonacea TaxID=47853 RepID=A0A1C5ABI8_9ACTN|nr:hypothetical protein [Micromonospora carbonacea]SCF42580.1 hypothetical protein GA0070563_11298 [Micromonospora carbonacea]
MATDDLMAWAGPAWAELTDEQRDQLADAAADITQRYPDPDDQDDRDAALSATVQYLLGETTADDTARALLAARQAARAAYVAAVQHAVMLHRVGGSQKKTAALACGIDRMTLLKALGER